MANRVVRVFWGAAIILFLSRIINLHSADKQGFWVEVSSQIETGTSINIDHVWFTYQSA